MNTNRNDTTSGPNNAKPATGGGRLVLSRETVRGLRVRSGVQTGGDPRTHKGETRGCTCGIDNGGNG
jgi:hypothetical protein